MLVSYQTSKTEKLQLLQKISGSGKVLIVVKRKIPNTDTQKTDIAIHYFT